MGIKNKVIERVSIENVAAEGKCVARIDDKVVFVEGVAPGDVVDIRIVRKKKSFLEAVPTQFHSYSEKRTDPFCQHFGTCGGCKWQHLPYDLQLNYKTQQVTDNLERIAKVPLPAIADILPSANTQYYRNKLEYTFSNKRWLTKEEISNSGDLERNGLGFHIPKRFDKILDIDHCYLQPDPSNDIRLKLKAFAIENDIPFFDLITQTGFLRNLIIRTSSTGQVMILLQVAQPDEGLIEKCMSFLKSSFPETASLNYVVNTKKNETFHDLEIVNYAGKPFIEEQMPIDKGSPEKLTFRVGPKSFYQTNSFQAYELYQIARDFAQLSGSELVYDLYTGTGTIANFVAAKAKKVIGLEYVEAAIEDAKVNSEINGISNTDFYAGDIKDLLNDAFLSKHGKPDVVITDPPRAGMHEDVVKMLLKAAPQKIVYVSCNPATQARDVALLDEKYTVKAVQPVDMFPHTHHVENVVLLELKS